MPERCPNCGEEVEPIRLHDGTLACPECFAELGRAGEGARKLYDVQLSLAVEAGSAAEALKVASEAAKLIEGLSEGARGSGTTLLERVRHIDVVRVSEGLEGG